MKKLPVILFLLLLTSCSTQRNTWWSRNYNSFTARYNILFNGEQSFKGGENQLIELHQDNFTNILYLFPFSGAGKAGLVKNYMDRAIEKGQKVIRERSITVRPSRTPSRDNARAMEFYSRREFNRYVDDALLLIGKAHLYNHDFHEALAVLEHVTREFAGQPASFEAVIWMARARIEMGDHENALLLLNRYDAMGQAPERLFGDYMATYADYLIRSGQPGTAIPFMLSAAAEADNKWDRSRRLYILAQLYQLAGNYSLARDYFSRVARSRPGHQMELHAQVNYHLLEGKLHAESLLARKYLYRLANQTKNRDYRDLIYHGLAQSYLMRNDTLNTILNLALSAGYNRNNPPLRLETYLQLAEIFFQRENFPASFSYQDSSLMLMPAHDPRLPGVKYKHRGLELLTNHLATISREDSLQRVARLPEPALENHIASIIERAREAHLVQMSMNGTNVSGQRHDPMFLGGMGNQLNQQQGGQWYFFNPGTVSLGKMEFERRWGRRANEDNWRRSNRTTTDHSALTQLEVMPGMPEFNDQVPQANGEQRGAPAAIPGLIPTRESLLANLPLLPGQFLESENQEALALFGAGMVFYDHFRNKHAAAKMFYQLASSHPGHSLAEQAWFWGYRSYEEAGVTEGMQRMKSGLLRTFPGGQYAPFVTNPLHADNIRHRATELDSLYEEAYNLLISNRLQEALAIATTVQQETTDPGLSRKSELLSALIKGRSGNLEGFRAGLQTLGTNHPGSHEAAVATRWLNMLEQGHRPAVGAPHRGRTPSGAAIAEGYAAPVEGMRFSHEPGQPHLVFLVVNQSADINRLVFNIADYNFSSFLLADYDITNYTLPRGKRLIAIGEFANQLESMDYYFRLRSTPGIFKVANIETAILLSGTRENLDTILDTGELDPYIDFFSRAYLHGQQGVLIPVGADSPAPDQATRAPEEQLFLETDYGPRWGIVVLPPNTDQGMISSFLRGLAFNQLRLNVTTRVVELAEGETVMIIERFENPLQARNYFNTLQNNNHWNTRLRAAGWLQTAISPGNFEIIENHGSTASFRQFIDAAPR